MEFLGIDLRWHKDGALYAVVFWETREGMIKPTAYDDGAQVDAFILRARRERRPIRVATKLDGADIRAIRAALD